METEVFDRVMTFLSHDHDVKWIHRPHGFLPPVFEMTGLFLAPAY